MKHTQIDAAGADIGTFRSYALGFTLSMVLTVISFACVMTGLMSRPAMLWLILSTAVLQILVHLHFFLHLNTSSTARWNILALLFTLLIMTIFVGGSIWIMVNLNYRMM